MFEFRGMDIELIDQERTKRNSYTFEKFSRAAYPDTFLHVYLTTL